ncbi:NAD(P)/FAD-dependent oxidoreductase [Quadrisphaera sp. DSM 44207]|uniref:NAD(P)/FAD-dependent oxidoreductase n=1 Tax=Quadrisphaera sp. DSM 44207 TaxID=1881057 RepID=UPI000B85CA15
MHQCYDVVVVGGGAAGLSAAVALSRARRDVLVLDDGAPRNALAHGVHNYLALDGVAPGDLLAAGREEVARYGGHLLAAAATSAQRLPGPLDTAEGAFAVTLADGREVRARRLLVTTGGVDDLPDVPGVAERWGREVVHCPYCHGWEVRDQPVAVLGTGPLAVHQALMWRQWSGNVTLLRHTAPELSDEQEERLAARGITVVDGRVTGLQLHDDQLTGVSTADGRVVPCRALVVSPRLHARSGVLTALGVEPAEMRMGEHVVATHVPAGPTGATAVPGVWAAGNVADPMAQVVSSAAQGLAAGAAINAELIEEDTARAVADRARRADRADWADRAGQADPAGQAERRVVVAP